MIKKRSLQVIEYLYGTVVGLIFLVLFILGRGKIRFDRSLPKTPFILASNHVSYADWIILHIYFRLVLGRKINFVAKKRLFERWYFRLLMHYSGAIYLDQERPSKNFFKMIKKSTAKNNIVGIFPEGTRSVTGKLLDGKQGIVRIIELTNLPVIPVGLVGFEKLWSVHQKFPRIARVSVNIGAPLCFKDVKGRENEVMSTIMEKIADLSGQNAPSAQNCVEIGTQSLQDKSGEPGVWKEAYENDHETCHSWRA